MRRALNIGLISLGLLLAGCAGIVQSPGTVAVEAPQIGAENFKATDGTVLPMRSWLPLGQPKAVIVALHGFGDYSAAFRTPGGYWASQGVATFAFDQRGFGGAPHVHRWAGADVMANDAKSVVRELKRRYPGVPFYLAGESMGGAVAIVATTGRQPAPVDGVILISPAIWEQTFLGRLERSALWLTRMTVPGWWLSPPRGLHIVPSDNVQMLRELSKDSLMQGGARVDTTAGLMDVMDEAMAATGRLRVPTLVLFGAHEEVLPPSGVRMFLDRLPTQKVRAAVYPDGYHMLLRDLHADIVWKDALAWIDDHAAPLPSGNECQGPAAAAPLCRPARTSDASGVSSGRGLR